jgi:hypothetical protein
MHPQEAEKGTEAVQLLRYIVLAAAQGKPLASAAGAREDEFSQS